MDKQDGWECHCGMGYAGKDCSLKVSASVTLYTFDISKIQMKSKSKFKVYSKLASERLSLMALPLDFSVK